MRYLKLTIWHLGLAVLIAAGTLVSIRVGVQALLPDWQTPWLLPLLVLVIVDAVLTQWLVERERQAWNEQLIVRGLEATLLVVVVKLASLSGEQTPLGVISAWVSDPFVFWGGRFSEYALASMVAWLLATLLTHRVLQIDAEPPPVTVRGLPIDQAVLLNERASALRHFDHLWIMLTMLAVAGGGLGLILVPQQMFASGQSLLVFGAVIIVLMSGLVLHSEGQLEMVRYRWQLEQLDVTPVVTQRWRRTSWLLIGGALLVAWALGNLASYAPPPPPLAPVLNLLLAGVVILTWLVVILVSLLLLPFAWLLSLLRGDTAPPPIQFQPPVLPPVAQTAGERSLLPGLIFWGCVVLLLGLALMRYLRQREDVRQLLGRWRGWQWLQQLGSGTLRDMHGWSRVVLQTMRRWRRPPRPIVMRRAAARTSRDQLRTLYRRMVRLSVRHGISYRASHTPYEFSQTLQTDMPVIEAEARHLTDAYVAAEYGPDKPDNGDVRRARRWWHRIQRVLLRRRRALTKR